jgi:hypothetical protein
LGFEEKTGRIPALFGSWKVLRLDALGGKRPGLSARFSKILVETPGLLIDSEWKETFYFLIFLTYFCVKI